MTTNSEENAASRSAARLEMSESMRDMCRMAGERLEQGQYSLAVVLYRTALTLAEEVHGSDSMEAAQLCKILGLACILSGNLDEAEQVYRRALPILEQFLGVDHAEVLMLHRNLGGLHHAPRANPAEADASSGF